MSILARGLYDAAKGVAGDLRDPDEGVGHEEAKERADEEHGGMFPRLDRGSRYVTERVYEGPGNFRGNLVDGIMPGDLGRDELGMAADAATNQREESRDRDEENIVGTFARDWVEEDSKAVFNLATGIDADTGERSASGAFEVTTPAWYLGGPATRGAGAAARGAATMAGKTGSSARASMKSASTYMPERIRNLASAPARSNAADGVKGATGSVVRAGGSAGTSAARTVESIPFGPTMATVGGVGVATGALGNALAGDVEAIPNDAVVLHVIDEMHDPFCLIFELRKDEDAHGYAAVLSVTPEDFEEEPDSAMVIKTGPGVRAERESWPPEPSFGSPEEARAAYDKLNSEMNDPPNPPGGLMDSGPYDTPEGSWSQPQHERAVDGGWHLFSQQHESEDRSRYIVVGYRRDGSMLYLDGDVRAHQSFAAFKERAEATVTVEEWLRRLDNGDVPASMQPDASADRPHPTDVGGVDANGVLNTRVRNTTLVKVGAALAGIAIGLVLLGGI